MGCRAGGHLAAVNDANENNWILGTFSGFGGVNHSLWIGFNDPTHSQNFVWANGEPVTYTNWRPGEPNTGFGSDYYTYMYPSNITGFVGQWNNTANMIFPAVLKRRCPVSLKRFHLVYHLREPACISGLQ